MTVFLASVYVGTGKADHKYVGYDGSLLNVDSYS
jgi:hypothetical protein